MTTFAEWSNSRCLEILIKKRKQSRSHFPWRKIIFDDSKSFLAKIQEADVEISPFKGDHEP